MDKFRRMEIFVAMVEAGQLTRAAQNLRLSKSAVSHALSDLETYLDLQLLNRDNRSWRLTDAGSTYFKLCKKILNDVEAMEDTARGEGGNLSGLIRISATSVFGSYTLVPVLAKFMDKYPDIVISLNITERYVDLIEERVDLMFFTGQLKDNNLVTQQIGEVKAVVFASPDYIEKYGAPQSHIDLKYHKCIQYTRNPKWRLSKDGRTYEFIPKNHIFVDHGEPMRELCIRGQGLAMMPGSLADFAVKKGRLVEVLSDYKCDPIPITTIRMGGSRVPNRVLRLLDFVTDEIQSRKNDASEFVMYGTKR